MKEIIIEIDNQGEIILETKGFAGKGCKAESQFIKDFLGEETSSQLTPAYYNSETEKKKRYLALCG